MLAGTLWIDGTSQECPVHAERKDAQYKGCSHWIGIGSLLLKYTVPGPNSCVRTSWTWYPCTGKMLTSKSESYLLNKSRHKCKHVLDLEVKIF